MANSKISALTSATTPLAGTEVLPIVQSSTTKQVSVANLTAGRTQTSNGIVQGTAATGYNFTANTPASGMTSQLLNWYEEGAYTPTAGGFVVVLAGGTVTYAGKYTRVGRLVKVTITIVTTGAATVAAAGGATCSLTLPFAPSTIDSGTWANTSTFATSGVVTVNTNQNMYVVNSWTAANSSWTLQASYNV